MTGMRDDAGAFFQFWVLLLLTSQAAYSFGLAMRYNFCLPSFLSTLPLPFVSSLAALRCLLTFIWWDGCSTLILDFKKAMVLATVSILFLMLISGFYVNPDNIPVWLRWIQWLAIIKFSFSAGMQVVYPDNRVFPCGGLSLFPPFPLSWHLLRPLSSPPLFPMMTMEVLAAGGDSYGYNGCPITGSMVKDQNNLPDLSYGALLAILIGVEE